MTSLAGHTEYPLSVDLVRLVREAGCDTSESGVVVEHRMRGVVECRRFASVEGAGEGTAFEFVPAAGGFGGGPFPGVVDEVVYTEWTDTAGVGRDRGCRARAGTANIAFGWGRLVSPGPDVAAGTSSSFLPLLAGRQGLLGPSGIGGGVVPAHPDHRVIGDLTGRSRTAPVVGCGIPLGRHKSRVIRVGGREDIDPVPSHPYGLVLWPREVDPFGNPGHELAVSGMAGVGALLRYVGIAGVAEDGRGYRFDEPGQFVAAQPRQGGAEIGGASCRER